MQRRGARRTWRTMTGVLAASASLGGAALSAAAAPDGWSVVRSGTIVLLRHALAPGTGDPSGFHLNDCRTQRNLSDEGRAQARRVGEAFRNRGIDVPLVLTSQWCRTRETAALAFPGRVRDEAVFNSFFGDPAREPERTRAALNVLTKWRGPGVLVVVTHQVNITALTSVVPASGEGVVVRPSGRTLVVLGRVRP